ncbi:hypothetical protein SAMN05192559_11723 [Halobacillus karajensis]|uniref:hypothetical protein n=1 Tax=Halobacillus karajensis TaxID=195088 RepID=UPI0008A7E045|nr:hypothetical protein [Halobacillus karajensis]SEI13412.1 hypothetical protein SAMN05192559_11723 [Halobacillus karajensis]
MEDVIKKLEEWAEIIQKHLGNMDEELVEVFLDMCGYAAVLQSRIERLEDQLFEKQNITH